MKRLLILALTAVAVLITLGTAMPARAAEPCPPDVKLELDAVPQFVPWGARHTIYVYAGSDGDAIFHTQTAAWADGEVFAQSEYDGDVPFDFWIGGVRYEPPPSFVVSWTATYYDASSNAVECEGSTGVIPVRTGLDKRILINKSIAAIQLQWPISRVRDALGPPPRVSSHFGGDIRVYAYPGLGVRVWLMRVGGVWKVHSVRIKSRIFKTAKGVGVGSSVRALRSRHPSARCFSARGWGECLFRQLSPRPTTIFSFRRARITEVAITHMGD